jgi:hypothetical protein
MLQRVPRGRNQPDAVTTANAMPEPPAAAKTAAHGRRPSPPRRSPALHGVDHHRLAAAPLLSAIQQRARLRRQSLRELLGPELFGAYGNAQSTGTVRLVTLERFCDEILGWHPRMIYGEAYDQATLPPP